MLATLLQAGAWRTSAAEVAVVAVRDERGGHTIQCRPVGVPPAPTAQLAPSRGGPPVRALAVTGPTRPLAFTLRFSDDPDKGFHDPMLGSDRRAALAAAADILAKQLPASIGVVIEARMESIAPLSGNLVVLGLARAATLHSNFPGAPLRDTAYPAALANQLVFPPHDINGDQAEVVVRFNLDVDAQNVVPGRRWYYGTDENPAGNLDFVSVALHELVHGVGFFSLVSPVATCVGGSNPGKECTANTDCGTGTCEDKTGAMAQASVFDRHLIQRGVKKLADMTDAERRAALDSDNVVFEGEAVEALHGESAKVLASVPVTTGGCESLRPGRSRLSHWDPLLRAPQLMAPVMCAAAIHDLGLALPALVDLGWTDCLPGHPMEAACVLRSMVEDAKVPPDQACPPRSRNPFPNLVTRVDGGVTRAFGAANATSCKRYVDEAVRRVGVVKSTERRLRKRHRLCRADLADALRGEATRLSRMLRQLKLLYCEGLPDAEDS